MMASQPITVNLPESLYERLQQRAAEAQRTLEEELLDAVAATLPPDLNEALSSLALLDDEALWRAAQSHLPLEAAAEMERLHLKRQREGLTESEDETVSHLVQQYERYMLVRAQATTLLQERGYVISALKAST
jgi:plasmid stability protein